MITTIANETRYAKHQQLSRMQKNFSTKELTFDSIDGSVSNPRQLETLNKLRHICIVSSGTYNVVYLPTMFSKTSEGGHDVISADKDVQNNSRMICFSTFEHLSESLSSSIKISLFEIIPRKVKALESPARMSVRPLKDAILTFDGKFLTAPNELKNAVLLHAPSLADSMFRQV